ncbi:T9SS type A sorting domain-containing protein [Flavobacterium anhuiense]|uniref:T9SS type A sorting domain-containing protein n=1 Tax=Flavobacterium anhuiense TaxID=459526 RepID=UPI0034D9605C
MKSKLLLLLLLANFSFYAQTNLVPNGDFETWSVSSKPDNWFQYFSGYISKSTVAQNGSSSINMMVASGTFNFINTEYFPVTAGKTYIVTMYHKLAKGTFSSVDFSLQHKPGTFKEIIIQKSDVVFSSTEWRKIEFEYTPTVSENVEVDIWTTGSLNSEILVDNVSVIDKYTSIPDINFENKLIDLGIDTGTADGKVLTSSISSVTSLDVSRSSISDLTGIENFTSLQTLIASRNSLTSVNLSKNTKLTYLDLGTNQLTALDLNTNTALDNLDCQKNKLAALDISNNTSLTRLNCSSNALTSLNVTANTLLTELATNSNKITSLNIDNNVALQSINCGGNLLTTLNVDKNLALKSLWCGSNKLTSLNIDKNLELSDLNCGINELTSLNVLNNKKLVSLVCHQNKITTLNVSQNILLEQLMCHYNELTSIDVWHNPELYMLNCHFNKITDLDISKNPKITEISCNDNNLTYLNLKNGNNNNFELFYTTFINNPNLTCIQVDNVIYANTNWSDKKDAGASFNVVCGNYTLIPDINFENRLIALGYDSGIPNGKVLTANISNITSLNVSSKSISDLTGIQDFTSLTTLNCAKNSLASLDLSNNKNLKTLYCEQNLLTTLDLSNNTSLITLQCSNNKLQNVNISKNLALKNLYCVNNQLTNIDVSNNTLLEQFYCFGNQLTSLNVTKNLNLLGLECGLNKLTTLDVSKNTLMYYLECYSNQLTSLDVTKNSALFHLNFFNNQLISIDLSDNILLKELYCSDNQLKSLDLSKNNALTNLDCKNNKLTALNLKNGNNVLLATIDLNFKQNPDLTCIQVDNVTYSNTNWPTAKDATASFSENCDNISIPDSRFEQKLIDLGIDTDGLNGKITIANASSVTNLNLSNSNVTDLTGIEYFTSLITLDVSNNQLTTVDVSKNLELETLNASSNQLTTLDLSKNTRLRIVYVVNNPLVYLNLRNGNNANFILPSNTGKKSASALYTTFLGLTSLSCIQVDDENYSNANWSNIKESTTTYSNTCKSLGIDKSEFSQVIVYPNPTKGEINISNIALDKATVYNSLGQLVKSFTLNNANTNNTIDLSGLPRGVYYVYLINGDAASAKKVIIE